MAKSKKYYEFGVIMIIVFLYVIMTTMSTRNLSTYFLQFTLLLCAAGCVLLMYYMLTNPLYVFGQRATINFAKEGEGFSGNPHIFSKVAFFGIVVTSVLFKTTEKTLFQFFLGGCMIVFFVVLVLTQTMLAYLATAIFAAVFVYYNVTVRGVLKTSVFLVTKWYTWVVLLFVIYKGAAFLSDKQEVVDAAIKYFENRFAGIFDSLFSDDTRVNNFVGTGDESANTRVGIVKTVFEGWVENLDEGNYVNLLFGNGYKHIYVDVPWIEALDSYGIVGFLVYSVLFIYMIVVSHKEVRNPRSPFTEFVAYGFIYFMVLNLTGGLLVDYARWGYYALVCRFIPLPPKKKSNVGPANSGDELAVKG